MKRLRELLDGGFNFSDDIVRAVIGESQCTCRDAAPSIRKMIAMIAPQLPDDVEWPRFEDGELVQTGDFVAFEYGPREVRAIVFSRNGSVDNDLTLEFVGQDDLKLWPNCVQLTRPVVLDANGEPIEIGDTVWRVFNSQKGTVVAIEHDGTVRVDHGNGERSWGISSLLTHIEPEPPDSWERLIGDAATADDEGTRGMCKALVLRAQALIKAGEGE